jgi:hypothetical protein
MKKSVHGTTKISVRIRNWGPTPPAAKAVSTLFADVFALSKSYGMRVLRVVSKLSRVCKLSLTNRIDGDKRREPETIPLKGQNSDGPFGEPDNCPLLPDNRPLSTNHVWADALVCPAERQLRSATIREICQNPGNVARAPSPANACANFSLTLSNPFALSKIPTGGKWDTNPND